MTVQESSQHPEPSRDFIVIGQIAGVYGIKGWVKVLSYTRPRNNILHYSPWYLVNGDHGQDYQVLACKEHGKGIIAQLEGIDDRDAAIRIMRHQITIERASLAPLPEGEYYWHDLIGLEVVNTRQQSLGKVSEIQETGANDVFIVQGDKRELIPWVSGVYVLEINVSAGQILVDWDNEEPDQ